MKQVFVAMTIVALSMGVTYDDGRTDGVREGRMGAVTDSGRARIGAPVATHQDYGPAEANVEDSGHDVSDAGTDAGADCVTLVYVPAEHTDGALVTVAHYSAIDPPEGFRHGTVGDFVWWAFDQALTDDVLWDNEQFQSFEIDGQDRVVCDE